MWRNSLIAPAIVVSAVMCQQPAMAQIAGNPSFHRVSSGEMVLSSERDGTLEASARSAVRVVPRAYGGPMVVREVLKRGGRVKAGEVILRLEGVSIEDELRAAREALEDQRLRLAWAQREQAIQKESAAIRLEQAEKSKADADRALMIFNDFEGPKMLRSAELGFQNHEFNVADQKEELSQLESMYKGTTLATDTKDIVLQRAQRGLKMAEQWLEIAKGDRKVSTEFNYPARKRDVGDAARWAAIELEHARISTSIAEARKASEVLSAERAVRDSEARLAKLEADQQLLEVTAPSDGVLTPFDLQPGDMIGSRQAFAQVCSPESLEVKLSVPPEDLRVLAVGSAVRVAAAGLPDSAVDAKVTEIGEMASADGTVPVRIALAERHPLFRVGMKCRVHAEQSLERTLSAPKSAVTTERGRSVVQVRKGESVEAREVKIGASQGDWVQILSGVSEGDEIVVSGAPKS